MSLPSPDNGVAADILRLCEEHDREWALEGWQTVLTGHQWQLRASPSGVRGTLAGNVSVNRKCARNGTIPFLLQIDNTGAVIQQEEGKRTVNSHFAGGDIRPWVKQALVVALAWFDRQEEGCAPGENTSEFGCLGDSFWDDD